MHAVDRLIEKIARTDNPSVMGLDPRPDILPPCLRRDTASPESTADAYLQFNLALLEACAGIVPAVKFQAACYEALGVPGLKALRASQERAAELDYFIINDAKRGDIASSAEFYARAWLSDEAWIGDALTVNPYLGYDSLESFFRPAREHGKMLFVLLRTSNPGARDFQDLELKDGRSLYEAVGDSFAKWGEKNIGTNGYSDFGAVVGATWPGEGAALRERLPSVYFLVPGYGAQGAGAAEVAGTFDARGRGALINSSRGLIGAWRRTQDTDPEGRNFAAAARTAALAMAEDLRSALKEGR